MFTALWIILLVMFGAIEGVVLFNKKSGDTFSEHVWSWFSIKGKGWGWRGRRFALLALLAWLAAHFLTGGAF